MAEPSRGRLPGGAGITMTLVFDASPEDLWKEWTDPAAFADWFGGPDSVVPLETVMMDVRVGGAWRLTMFVRTGRQIEWIGEYLDVDEPRRLVLTITDQPASDARELVTVLLTPRGDGRTEMYFEQRGLLSPDEYERAREGWSSFFDRIAVRLAGNHVG